MTSNSPGSAPAAKLFRRRPLTLEAAAFLTIFLGLVYLFARNCPVRSSRNRRKERNEEELRTPSATEFMISENQIF
jgi:hypothetical protein